MNPNAQSTATTDAVQSAMQNPPAPTTEQQNRPPLQFVPRMQRSAPSGRFWLWLAGALALTGLLAYVIAEGEEAERHARARRRHLRGYTRAGEGRVRELEDDGTDDEDDEDEDDEDYPPASRYRNRRITRSREPVSHRSDGAPAPGAPTIHYHMTPSGNTQAGGTS